MSQPQTERVLDQLAHEIHACVEARPGRLSWVRVSAPVQVADDVRDKLSALLTRMGLDFVDIEVSAQDGDPKVLDVRFDEGWS
ncbi:MAG: hypothetical protein EA397_12860 [Deltaproteobacteria bacterium]|nr:MAG: hypothetical protein EA397_12860 [Deltaproteobacteria bacterium]